jgi:hypothetical protein
MRSVLRSVVFAGPYVTHHPFWSKAEAMQQVMARKLTRGVSGHDRSHQLIAVQCLSSVLPPKFFLVGEIERFNVKKTLLYSHARAACIFYKQAYSLR